MTNGSLAQPARSATQGDPPRPPTRDEIAEAVEEVLARLKQARPNLEGRIDRAAGYLVLQLASPTRSRPIICRVRRGGTRVLLVASLTSPGVVYEVNPIGWSCSCRDCFRNGPGCKHALAGYALTKATESPPRETSEDAAQEAGDDQDPEASMPQEEPSEGLTYAEVEAWLAAQRWITAKSRPDNPHSYCLKRDTKDPEMFDAVVRFIQERGDIYRWWGADYRQLVANRHAHWSMSGPGQAILINRKDLEQVRKDELRNRGGGGLQWRWLHGPDIEADRAALRREEQGQDELGEEG